MKITLGLESAAVPLLAPLTAMMVKGAVPPVSFAVRVEKGIVSVVSSAVVAVSFAAVRTAWTDEALLMSRNSVTAKRIPVRKRLFRILPIDFSFPVPPRSAELHWSKDKI